MEETPQTQNAAENNINPPVNPNGYGDSTLQPEQIQELAAQGTTPLENRPVAVPDAFRSEASSSEAPTTLKDINTPEKVLEKYDDQEPSLQRFGADKPIRELAEAKVPEEKIINDSQKALLKDKGTEKFPSVNPIIAKSEDEAELLRAALPGHVPVKIGSQKEKTENTQLNPVQAMQQDRTKHIFQNIQPVDLEKIKEEVAQEDPASKPPFPDYTPKSPTTP